MLIFFKKKMKKRKESIQFGLNQPNSIQFTTEPMNQTIFGNSDSGSANLGPITQSTNFSYKLKCLVTRSRYTS